MDLKCFDRVIVGKPEVNKDTITANYTLEYQGKQVSCKLRSKYEANIEGENAQMYANLIASVPAINQGLFADEIIFEYDLRPAEYAFFSVMLDKMCREIFVHEFCNRPSYIKKKYMPSEVDIKLVNAMPIAKFHSGVDGSIDKYVETDNNKAIILSSGGKESLLCYGVLKEAGVDVYPVFMNESGGHWKTALTAYRHFNENEPKTMRVWHNLDHLFLFLVRNMRILDQGIIERRSQTRGATAIADPINLFSFAHYIFSTLPLAEKYSIGNICMGSEYDDPSVILKGENRLNDISFFPGVYDQSLEFEVYVNDLFKKDKLNVQLWSPVRSITGFLVEKILGEKYQPLFKLQRSCHHTHMKDGEVLPCGFCQKCMRLIAFNLANGSDYQQLGYTTKDAVALESRLDRLRLGQDELEHTLFKLSRNGLKTKGIEHPNVERLHFDRVSSPFENVPDHLRDKVYRILLSNSQGAVRMNANKWEGFDLESRLNDKKAV